MQAAVRPGTGARVSMARWTSAICSGAQGRATGAAAAAVPAMVRALEQALAIFGRELLNVCVKFQAARGRRARAA